MQWRNEGVLVVGRQVQQQTPAAAARTAAARTAQVDSMH